MNTFKNYLNSEQIARGLSPFQPEKAGIEAGRLMLKKLLESDESFAFETTLATKSYVNLLESARESGYQITLLFFWLHSPELAVSRVKNRVKEGGHNIPEDVIRRRYTSGLHNFFKLYFPVIDNWLFINNSGETYEIIAEGSVEEITINNELLWNKIRDKYYGN